MNMNAAATSATATSIMGVMSVAVPRRIPRAYVMYGMDMDSPYRLSTSLPSMSILMEKTDTKKDIAMPDILSDPREGSRT